jgi:hypothetical protein
MTGDTNVLDLSQDEIDALIGDALLADEFGAKPASAAEKRQAARLWFQSNLGKIRTAVCPNLFVKSFLLGKDNKTRNELLAAVVDALLKLGGWGVVPVAVLSARIINYGLDQLCPSEKPESKAP